MLPAPINAEVNSDQSHTDSIDLHNSGKLHCLSVVSHKEFGDASEHLAGL